MYQDGEFYAIVTAVTWLFMKWAFAVHLVRACPAIAQQARIGRLEQKRVLTVRLAPSVMWWVQTPRTHVQVAQQAPTVRLEQRPALTVRQVHSVTWWVQTLQTHVQVAQ